MENHSVFHFPDVNHDPDGKRAASINMILLCVLPFEIILGLFANIWALRVIIKRRLWLQHEGYVCLGAVLITNALILILHYVCIWFWCLDDSYAITRKADFVCKVWTFFFNGFYCTGWLVVALLFDVILRGRWATKEGSEDETPNRRPSRCALIVVLTLIVLSLLMNTWKLVSFELNRFDDGVRIGPANELYCNPADDWLFPVLEWIETVALYIHGVLFVLILPVLFSLVACSGCSCCTRCKYGADSREHFPRRILLSVAAIVFLQFPASVWQLFGRPRLLFNSFTYYPVVSELFCASILINGLIFAAVPILCIATMPRLREATFKADCCSCGRSRKLEIEAIALRETGQGN